MVRTLEIMKAVPEEGTGVFKCIFKDELGDAVVPSTLFWDLTALDGSVIAYNQEVTSLTSTLYLVLYGSDMRILDGEDSYGERLLTFRGTYNSTNGSGLPLHKQIKFKVQNLKMKAYPLSVSVVDVAFTDDYVRDVA